MKAEADPTVVRVPRLVGSITSWKGGGGWAFLQSPGGNQPCCPLDSHLWRPELRETAAPRCKPAASPVPHGRHEE